MVHNEVGPHVAKERRAFASLALELWARAGGAAKYALNNLATEDPDERIRVAVSLGLTVELLTMARLASADPALLAHGGSAASRVMLSQANSDEQLDLKVLRTLSADESAKMLLSLDPDFAAAADARAIMDFRNAAVHLARADGDAMSELVAALVRFVGQIHLGYSEATDADFWDETHLELVQAFRDANADKTELAYQSAKATAQAWLFGFLDGLAPEQAEAQQRMLEDNEPVLELTFESRHEVERALCPACGRSAYVHYSLQFLDDYNEQVDFDGDRLPDVWVEVSARWDPVAFECPVCRLRLGRASLGFVPGVEGGEVRKHVLDSDESAWYWSDSGSMDEPGRD